MPDLATRTAPPLAIEALTYAYPEPDPTTRPALSPYKGSNAGRVLRDVSLTLEAGEFALLAGRSACGKTTLLRAACGLVPHFHGGEVEGSVVVAGVDALVAGPGELAGAVGYVAQDPETQVVSTTVGAEIALPLELRGAAPTARARAVEEVALALAIPHLLDRTVDTLSGGELQRVALAAALVTRPRLVLLDEPTSQLDPVAGDELIWLLRRLNEEWGVTILLSEHRLERCLPAADRVIAMENGRIAFDGLPTDFLAWAQSNDPALETPAAKLFSLANIEPLPTGVRQARQILSMGDVTSTPPSSVRPGWLNPSTDATGVRGGDTRRTACTSSSSDPSVATPAKTKKSSEAGVPTPQRPPSSEADLPAPLHRPSQKGAPTALSIGSLWVELDGGDGPVDVLKGVDLRVRRGERVALMGRNGAGKSTLLRTVAGLLDPVRGKLSAPAGVALLTQNAGDYLVRERVGDELPGEEGMAALRTVGMEHAVDADPRDLSGGERQRLALAIVLAGRMEGDRLPGLIALDEPTRGMDRARKADLSQLVASLAESGAGLVVATHDVEFAAAFAERVVLLGDGAAIADGPAREVLSGGWYFATEVARILDVPGVIAPEDGAAHLRGARP